VSRETTKGTGNLHERLAAATSCSPSRPVRARGHRGPSSRPNLRSQAVPTSIRVSTPLLPGCRCAPSRLAQPEPYPSRGPAAGSGAAGGRARRRCAAARRPGPVGPARGSPGHSLVSRQSHRVASAGSGPPASGPQSDASCDQGAPGPRPDGSRGARPAHRLASCEMTPPAIRVQRAPARLAVAGTARPAGRRTVGQRPPAVWGASLPGRRPGLAADFPQRARADRWHRAGRECGWRAEPEVTVDVDGVVVVLDPSRRSWIVQRPLAVGRRLESAGYPAQRADPCIQSIHYQMLLRAYHINMQT
jgi:hypothetical protein